MDWGNRPPKKPTGTRTDMPFGRVPQRRQSSNEDRATRLINDIEAQMIDELNKEFSRDVKDKLIEGVTRKLNSGKRIKYIHRTLTEFYGLSRFQDEYPGEPIPIGSSVKQSPRDFLSQMMQGLPVEQKSNVMSYYDKLIRDSDPVNALYKATDLLGSIQFQNQQTSTSYSASDRINRQAQNRGIISYGLDRDGLINQDIYEQRLVNKEFQIDDGNITDANGEPQYLVISNEAGGHCYYLSIIDSGATFNIELWTLEITDDGRKIRQYIDRLGGAATLNYNTLSLDMTRLCKLDDLLIRSSSNEGYTYIKDSENNDRPRYIMMRLLRYIASLGVLKMIRDRNIHLAAFENRVAVESHNTEDFINRLLDKLRNGNEYAEQPEILALENALQYKSLIINQGDTNRIVQEHMNLDYDKIIPIWYFGAHYEVIYDVEGQKAYYDNYDDIPDNLQTKILTDFQR